MQANTRRCAWTGERTESGFDGTATVALTGKLARGRRVTIAVEFTRINSRGHTYEQRITFKPLAGWTAKAESSDNKDSMNSPIGRYTSQRPRHCEVVMVAFRGENESITGVGGGREGIRGSPGVCGVQLLSSSMGAGGARGQGGVL